MKAIQKYFKVMLYLMINIIGIANVSAATNPYNQTGTYGVNCTWYAWQMAYDKANVTLPGWGNAKEWYNNAKEDGYTVSTTPRSNSIIVWGDWTSYGHVGYVESVEGNILHVWDSTGPCIDKNDEEFRQCIANSVSEETDKICYANAKEIACEYTISPDQYGITGYIYLDYPPEKKDHSSQDSDDSSLNDDSSISVVSKSNNTNLSSIEISSGVIPFSKEVDEYYVEVENEVDTITINATLEDDKATLKGIGEYKLNVGLNEIRLIVTAEDSSLKEYTVQVFRGEKEEDSNINIQTEEIPKNNNLKIIVVVFSVSVIIIFIFCLIFGFRKKYNR